MMLLGRRPEDQKSNARLRTRLPPPNPNYEFKFPETKHPFQHRRPKAPNFLTGARTAEKDFPLKTKAAYVKNSAISKSPYDYYDSDMISKGLFDLKKSENPEYYDKMSYGVQMPDEFPDLPDDVANIQGLQVPRFEDQKFDEENNYRDVHEHNKIRLKALDGGGEPGKGKYKALPFYQKREESELHKRVDKIVEALEKHRGRYNHFEDEELLQQQQQQKQENSKKRSSNYGDGGVFRRSGSILMKRKDVDVNDEMVDHDKEFYMKKNQVNEKDFFQNPDKYRNWDKQFNVEDFY